MLPFIAIFQALAGGAVAYAQSQAVESQGRFAYRIAMNNAAESDKQALDAVERGYVESNYAQGRTDRLTSDQRTALASQGLDVNSGVGLALQNDAALVGANDRATIKVNAYKEAHGYKTQALNIRTQGKLDRIKANYKSKNMLLEGALKALGGAASAFGGPSSLQAGASSGYGNPMAVDIDTKGYTDMGAG